jgi:hypothetical protein
LFSCAENTAMLPKRGIIWLNFNMITNQVQ